MKLARENIFKSTLLGILSKIMNHYYVPLLLIFLFINPSIIAQSEQIRLLSYNLMTYTSGDRDTYFQTIFSSITPSPDIISTVEIDDATSGQAINFLNNVLGSIGTYKMGTFVPSGQSDVNAIYYNPSKFTFLSSRVVVPIQGNTNHPSYEYQLYNNLTGDKIILYGIHLSSQNTASRDTDAVMLRSITNSLPVNSFYIAAGDFNLSNGTEAAYSTLTDNGSGSGYFLDAVTLTGSWNTDSTNYIYQTYSTDNMRYRYDLILNSQSVVDAGGVTFIGNYTAYGNDGLHHNLGIRQYGTTGLNNQAVSQKVASALYSASDHLPVYADYNFAVPANFNPPYPGSIVFTQVGVNDGSGNNFIEFMTLYNMNLTTLKITSNAIQSDGSIGSGNVFDLSFTNWTNVPAGTFIRLGANLTDDNDASDRILQYSGDNGYTGTLPNLTSGSNQLIAYTGSSPSPTYYIAGIHWGDMTGWTTSSNAPFDTPSSANIALTGSVDDNWYYSSSVNGDLYTTRNALTTASNWGSTTTAYHNLTGNISYELLPVELSSFSGRVVNNKVYLQWRTETEVNNYGFEIQRSTDRITWSKIGFVPGSGNSNAPKDYSFTDQSLPNGTLYYRLKQEDLDGKFEYSKEINLNYNVASDVVLYQNYPNPFNPTTKIEYFLPISSHVSLIVYDLLGRKIVTLKNEYQTAGKHSVEFNGTNLSSGIYFYVLAADNFTISKKMSILH